MKTSFLFFLFIVVTVIFVSCDPAANITTNTSQNVSSGTWHISLFTDSGNDETADFSGYSFTFNGNGILTVLKNGISQNGTWSVSSSSNKFSIGLGTRTTSNKPLGELTDDWKILSNSTTEIRLQDDNTARNEFVTFTKN